jgi:DNA modification methylase
MEKCEPHKRNHGKGKNEEPSNSCYGKFVSTPTIISDEKFPTSIISISKPHKNTEYFHPTQKSVECIEYLVKTYTNEGDTVLDNTFGSCTCGVACKNLNRNFIGIEMDENYFEIAKKRIE